MKRIAVVIMTLAGLVGAAVTASAQDSKSSSAAATLTALLDQRKLDAVAARDPEKPDRFIAALYFPGSQLLVVSASYPVPAVLERRLAMAEYREAYLDLQGGGSRDGRFFVTDLMADGLRPTRERDAPFDIVYTNGVDQISYDSDWKNQKLSESEYNRRFAADDERYARILSVLTDALKGPATMAPVVPKPPR